MFHAYNLALSFAAGTVLLGTTVAAVAQNQPIQPFDERFSSHVGRIIGPETDLTTSELGVTLPHEHALIAFGNDIANLNSPTLAAEKITDFATNQDLFSFFTPRTLVDVTTRGLRWESCDPQNGTWGNCVTPGGRSVSPSPAPGSYTSSQFANHLTDIRDTVVHNLEPWGTPFNVILSTGYYQSAWTSTLVAGRSIDSLRDQMLTDMSIGIDGTGKRAGIIGEIGISDAFSRAQADDPNHPETKGLIAAARAQRASGAALTLHINPGSQATIFPLVEGILTREGVNPRKVIIGHCASTNDTDLLNWYVATARAGYNLEFDLFNDYGTEDGSTVRWLVEQGYVNRLLVSQDICRNSSLNDGAWGYQTMFASPTYQDFWSYMQSYHAAEITQILVNNPASILALERSGSVAAPLAVQWTTGYSDAGQWGSAAYYYGTIGYPDVNGDGIDDICGRAAAGIVCGLSGTTGLGPVTTWSTYFDNVSGWNSQDYYYATIRFPDLNNDGMADVCGRASDGIHCALSNGSSFGPQTLWTSAAYSNSGSWNTTPAYWGTIEFPDLNGDGKMDVCGRGAAGLYCALSNGTTFSQANLWNSYFSDANGWNSQPYFYKTIRYVDVDGDGKSDACGRASDGIRCALSSGTSFGTATLWSSYFSNINGWNSQPYYYETIRYADINGDGKADVCGRASDGVRCAMSSGSSFGTATLWNSTVSDANSFNSSPSYWSTLTLPDVNSDGRADLCVRSSGGIYCAFSDGSGSFSSGQLWSDGPSDSNAWGSSPGYYGTLRFADVDGDNRLELCGRSSGGITCTR